MSCTRLSRRSPALSSAACAAACGALWSWAALAVTSLVLPRYLELGVRTATGVWYMATAYTALLPVTAARAVTIGGAGAPSSARGGITPLVAAASAAIGCGIGIALRAALQGAAARRALGVGGVVFTLVALACSVGLSRQLWGLSVAEREFFVANRFASPDPQHPDNDVVLDARRFAAAHAESRWAPEALRVVALDAAAHRRYPEAAASWLSFAGSFAEPGLPGQAYGEYNAALCDEKRGDVTSARKHYVSSVYVIRQRGGDLQGWIAVDAAKRIARIDASRAMRASSQYWVAKGEAFRVLYRPEE